MPTLNEDRAVVRMTMVENERDNELENDVDNELENDKDFGLARIKELEEANSRLVETLSGVKKI